MRCDLRYDVVITITSSSGSNSTGYIVLLRVVGVTVEDGISLRTRTRSAKQLGRSQVV